MATESEQSNQLPIPLLYQAQATDFTAGSSVNNPLWNCYGYKRIVGNVHVSTAAASGFPRIRQSANGVTFSRSDVILVDPTQSGFQYPFDIEIKFPYIAVEYTQGGVDSTFLYIQADAYPV